MLLCRSIELDFEDDVDDGIFARIKDVAIVAIPLALGGPLLNHSTFVLDATLLSYPTHWTPSVALATLHTASSTEPLASEHPTRKARHTHSRRSLWPTLVPLNWTAPQHYKAG
jgi:hypothetical protein